MFWNYLRNLTTSARQSAPRQPSYRPRLEGLEDRSLPSATGPGVSLRASPPVVHRSVISHTLVALTRPVITQQPTTETVVLGSDTHFTALASGNPLPTVQWQMKPVGA